MVDSPTAAVEMALPPDEMMDSMVDVEIADASADDAAPATPPKMVVDPTISVETADPSEEMIDSMAEVVTADGFWQFSTRNILFTRGKLTASVADGADSEPVDNGAVTPAAEEWLVIILSPRVW